LRHSRRSCRISMLCARESPASGSREDLWRNQCLRTARRSAFA
jgi:hypothetical protein